MYAYLFGGNCSQGTNGPNDCKVIPSQKIHSAEGASTCKKFAIAS